MRTVILLVLATVGIAGMTASAQTAPPTGLSSIGASGTSGGSAVGGTVTVGTANGIPCCITGTLGIGGQNAPFKGTPGHPTANPGGAGTTYTLEVEIPSSGGSPGFVGKIWWNSANPNHLSAQGTGGAGPGNSFPVSIP